MIFSKNNALPSILSKSIVEALNSMENYEDNLFWRKLVQSGFIVVSCQLQTLCQNSQQSKERGRCFWTSKSVRHHQKISLSALIHSRDRHTHFLEKKFAGKPISFARRREPYCNSLFLDSDYSLCQCVK